MNEQGLEINCAGRPAANELPAHHDEASRLWVVRGGDEYRVVATRNVSPGEPLLKIEGVRTSRPTRYSVQIGVQDHIAPPADGLGEIPLDQFIWRFMNHACEPNAAIRGQGVVAIRPIRAGEEVSFDYNTTEYDMAAPFACRCGSPLCRRQIRGFKHLPPAEREKLRPFVASHLWSHPGPVALTVLPSGRA